MSKTIKSTTSIIHTHHAADFVTPDAQGWDITDYAAMVDELGTLKATISALKTQEDAIKARLSQSGHSVVDGMQYRAAVSQVDSRPVIDWRAIAEHMNPSRQLVVAHTTHSDPYTTVRLSARKTV